jgi:hypothetical protein
MSDFLPLVLLFLFGGFAAVSALLKSRARVTAPLSVLLAVAEGISGMVLMGASLPGSGSLDTASRLGIVTAVLVAISSAVHLMTVRARGRGREASEGKRLYAVLQYGTADYESGAPGEPSELDESIPSGDGGDPAGNPGGDAGGPLG